MGLMDCFDRCCEVRLDYIGRLCGIFSVSLFLRGRSWRGKGEVRGIFFGCRASRFFLV